MVEMVPSRRHFPHAVVPRVGDVDRAIRGNRDRTRPIQLSSRRRSSVAAEPRNAATRNRGHGAAGTDPQNSVAQPFVK